MAEKQRRVRQSDLDRIAGALRRAVGALDAGDLAHARAAIADAEQYLFELRESGLIDDG